MKIIIDDARNGYIVNCAETEDSEDNYRVVFEFSEETGQNGRVEALKGLFWHLSELIGPSSGRYDAERISISTVHGDKYVCKDKKCSICKGVQ